MTTEETISEQQKPWSHPRTVTVKIPSNSSNQPELVVAFEVEFNRRSSFSKIFEDYLQFCANNSAIIRVKDEAEDSDSKELCSMTFEISGNRDVIGGQMQRIGNSLMQHSKRIK